MNRDDCRQALVEEQSIVLQIETAIVCWRLRFCAECYWSEPSARKSMLWQINSDQPPPLGRHNWPTLRTIVDIGRDFSATRQAA
jgi:hypothetical protein